MNVNKLFVGKFRYRLESAALCRAVSCQRIIATHESVVVGAVICTIMMRTDKCKLYLNINFFFMAIMSRPNYDHFSETVHIMQL